MIGLLGKKIGMTQIFDKDGNLVAVTVLELGPCTVLQLKNKETDGYQAVQLGYEDKKDKQATKPEIAHAKKVNTAAKRFVREVRTRSVEGLTPGAVLKVNNFSVGDWVDVVGTSIGRGFQGVVKRLNYKGTASKSHGSMMGRVPGTIGAKAGGVGCRKKVRKGKGLPGHMGDERVTTQNLRVLKVDLENNLIAIKGAVPGSRNGFVMVKEALKKPRPRNWRMPDQGIEEIKFEEKKMATKKAKKTDAKDKAPAAAAAKKK